MKKKVKQNNKQSHEPTWVKRFVYWTTFFCNKTTCWIARIQFNIILFTFLNSLFQFSFPTKLSSISKTLIQGFLTLILRSYQTRNMLSSCYLQEKKTFSCKWIIYYVILFCFLCTNLYIFFAHVSSLTGVLFVLFVLINV